MNFYDTMFLFCKCHLELIPNLISVGFDLMTINEHIIERLLNNTYITSNYLKMYMNVGFFLNDMVIKRTLAIGKLNVIEMLEDIVDRERLSKLAHETLYGLFGPYNSKNSLNVAWSASTANRLISNFCIKDSFIRKCILTYPEESSSLCDMAPSFPSTRYLYFS